MNGSLGASGVLAWVVEAEDEMQAVPEHPVIVEHLLGDLLRVPENQAMVLTPDLTHRTPGPAVVGLPQVGEAFAHLLPRVCVVADEPVVEEWQLHARRPFVRRVIERDP